MKQLFRSRFLTSIYCLAQLRQELEKYDSIFSDNKERILGDRSSSYPPSISLVPSPNLERNVAKEIPEAIHHSRCA